MGPFPSPQNIAARNAGLKARRERDKADRIAAKNTTVDAIGICRHKEILPRLCDVAVTLYKMLEAKKDEALKKANNDASAAMVAMANDARIVKLAATTAEQLYKAAEFGYQKLSRMDRSENLNISQRVDLNLSLEEQYRVLSAMGLPIPQLEGDYDDAGPSQ